MIKHLAIVMDGNGRWADQRGLKRLEGHKAGALAVERAIQAADRMGVGFLTLYAFSTENFKRADAEVQGIFDVIATFLEQKMQPMAREKGYRVRVIGNPERIAHARLKAQLDALQTQTAPNKGMCIVLALAYGGREEVCRALQKVMSARQQGDPAPLSYAELAAHLDTADLPDPDVVVRYGGYRRLSNFLLLQSAYAELFFEQKFWPDFSEEDLVRIGKEYEKIKRNFGEVG